jgi:microsomal dipeptidase-like Zn-dependent dipeptidase
MTTLRLSSLHDDIRMPWQDRLVTEYENYPERYKEIGSHREHSVLRRVLQFGVEPEEFEAVFGTTMPSPEAYEELVGSAVEDQYGLITASIYDNWSDLSGSQMMLTAESTALMVERWTSNYDMTLVMRGNYVSDEGTSILVSVEGMHFLDSFRDPTEKDVNALLAKLFMLNVRCFGLQYGQASALAKDGLTPLGRYAVEKLFQHGLLVDLAHALPKTRADVLDLAEHLNCVTQVVYTHGAPAEAIARDPDFSKRAESRGLKQDELGRLMYFGGLVGLGISRPFFTSAEHLAETIHQLVQIPDRINSLAIGADFGGVPPCFLLKGMKTPKQVCETLGNQLAGRYHFSEDAIRKILSENAKTWIRRNLMADD